MKYFQYIKQLIKHKQYRLALHPGDALFAFAGFLLSFNWYMEIDVLIEQYGADGAIVLSLLFGVFQLLWAIHAAKISLEPDKLVFYKVLGFRRIDIALLAFHTYALSAIAFSVFFALNFNVFVFDIGIFAAIYYFIAQLIIVFAMVSLLSKVKLKSSRSVRYFRSWDKLFRNKYIATSIKELFEIRRYPMLIFNHIFIALLIYFLVLIQLNYIVTIYIISAFGAGICYDSYAADGIRHFLYKFLGVSKYQLFKYKLFASFTFTLLWVIIYTIFYLILIADFTTPGVALLPVVLLNTCFQHFALGIVCVKKYPFRALFPALFVGLWLFSAIPVLSFALNIYAFSEMLKLRKAACYV